MALERRRDGRLWKNIFNFNLIVIISGLLYLMLFVTCEPVCYSRTSQDERNAQIKMVDCDSDNICLRFASREDVNMGELLNSGCAYPEDYLATHDKYAKVITCQETDLPTVSAGFFNCFGNAVGNKCNLICDDGYYPSSSKETVCEETIDNQANWTAGNFQCTVITCQEANLPTVNAGFFNCFGNAVGNKCNLTCDDGYHPSSSKDTVCEETIDNQANWTVGNFQCIAIVCSTTNLPTVANGEFDCAINSNVSKGTSCNLKCNDKSYPAYSNQAVCEAGTSNQGGVWSSGSFVCQCLECNDWNQWNGIKYKLISTKQTCQQSRHLCESSSSHLVTIENEEENEFVRTLVYQCSTYYTMAWIGLNDSYAEGTWEWTDGAVSTYRNWYRTEPNGGMSENCVVMFADDGEWHDVYCRRNHATVCETNN